MPRGSRRAEAQLGVNDRRLDPGLRRARRKFERFGRDTRRDLKRSFGNIRRDLTTLVGFAGAATFGKLAKDVYDFDKRLDRLGINAGVSAGQMARLRVQVQDLAVATGASREEILGAIEKHVELNGNLDQAAKFADVYARAMVGANAAGADLAATADRLIGNLKIDPGEIEAAFSIIRKAGKEGAVEFSDMSRIMAGLTPQFAQFKTGTAGLADMSAALQILMKGFGTADEAATGFGSIMTAITKNAASFEKAGIDIFDVGPDGTKRMRDFRLIIEDIANSKLVKDPTKLQRAFGRTEAFRAFLVLAQYRDRWDEIEAATRGATDIQDDFASASSQNSVRLSKAWERAKRKFAEMITPERVEKFVGLIEKLVSAIEVMADNLGVTIGLLGAAKLSPALLSFMKMMRGTAAIDAAAGVAGAAGTGVKLGRFGKALKAAPLVGAAAIGAHELANATLGAQEKDLTFAQDTAFLRDNALSLSSKLSPQTLAQFAREAGIVDEGGSINRGRIKAVATGQRTGENFYQDGSSLLGGRSIEELAIESAVRHAIEQTTVRVEVDAAPGLVAKTQSQAKRRGR